MNKSDLMIEYLIVWKRPSSYIGFSPDGDYLIYSRTRDSSILVNCNYEVILEELKKINSEYIYDFRASHWGYNWAEHILIKKDSPYELLKVAIEITCAISEYPVYDSMKYSERLNDAINEYWNCCPLREKIELCKKHNISIFAARHSNVYSISSDIYYEIEEYL